MLAVMNCRAHAVHHATYRNSACAIHMALHHVPAVPAVSWQAALQVHGVAWPQVCQRRASHSARVYVWGACEVQLLGQVTTRTNKQTDVRFWRQAHCESVGVPRCYRQAHAIHGDAAPHGDAAQHDARCDGAHPSARPPAVPHYHIVALLQHAHRPHLLHDAAEHHGCWWRAVEGMVRTCAATESPPLAAA